MVLAPLAWIIAPPLCTACGAVAGAGRALCAECLRALRWLGPAPVSAGGVELWAPVAYEGPAAALVRGLKFRGALRLAGVMGAQMAANAPPGYLRGALVPVPLHPSRRRRRGYNQAELVARALGSRTGLEVRDCLERTGPGGTQMGRGRAQRRKAIVGAISRRPGSVAPGVAVIVDDVATTGATLEASARALREAGSQELVAVAYARTPGR